MLEAQADIDRLQLRKLPAWHARPPNRARRWNDASGMARW